VAHGGFLEIIRAMCGQKKPLGFEATSGFVGKSVVEIFS
jgi:hypothetical protein